LSSPFPLPDSPFPEAGHRPFRSDAEAHAFCVAFAHATLPRAAWTHRAHLTAALWYLTRRPPDQVLDLVREAIKRYNRAVGTANTATSGYHETITVLYVSVVRAWYREADPSLGLAALANALYEACGDRDLPLRYYSKERLFSVEARTAWIEPDRAPLPIANPALARNRTSI
jgi:hypothetical protein